MGRGKFFNGILAGVAPSMNVNFIASTQTPDFGAIVSFTNLSSPTPLFNFWDFGDGSFSTASSPDKVYLTPGTFSVSLSAMDVTSGGIETKTDYIFVEAPEIIAIGGTETIITVEGETYKVHTFTQSGTFSVFNSAEMEYLIVAGGGGGATRHRGGGGAGGVVTNLGTASLITAGLYGIEIGQGGNGAVGGAGGGAGNPNWAGSKGTDSLAFGLTAFGGGAGGNDGSTLKDGGSGAGARNNGTIGLGISGQGNNGGIGSINVSQQRSYASGAGGGFSQVGGAATNNGSSSANAGGDGGDGFNAVSFLGTTFGDDGWFAGGGGGGAATDGISGGDGGQGGGGAGGSSGAGQNAIPYTGGGGGAGGFNDNSAIGTTGNFPGGNGASGVVIIRYKI